MKLFLASLCAVPALAIPNLPLPRASDGCTDERAWASTQPDAPERKDIVDTAVAAGSFRTLAAALQAADLVEALRGEGPFTVFAPTDEAFAKLPAGTLEALLDPKQKGALQSILTYHVVPGRVAARDVVKLSSATTLNGQRVAVQVVEGVVTIDGARVLTTDIACTNGIIHVIDRVILPASEDLVAKAKAAGRFGTLLAAVEAAGLTETLMGKGPFTVFAPTDAAFAALPGGTVESLLKPENRAALADILKHHVIPGRVYSDQALKAGTARTLLGTGLTVRKDEDGAYVGQARLTALDIQAANGVLHVVDAVLLPR